MTRLARTSRAALVAALLLSAALASARDTDFSFMADYLRANGIAGTVIVEDLSGTRRFVHGGEGENRRYLPASTFKIANTLIALEEGAIRDEREIIPWDGRDKGFPEWNKDQCVMTALPASCVWFYQELARRVGDEAYLRWLALMGYGNRKTGRNLDTFWLDGELRISPAEQIAFLRKVYREEFPFAREHYAALKEAMVVRRTERYVVRAKTGWTMRISSQVGWYVGYLEAGSEVWFFAVRIDIASERDAAFRDRVAFAALEGLGLLPSE